MSKVNVAVLRGGPSDEYDISMQTGEKIFSTLRDTNFSPVDIIISKQGKWVVDGYEREEQAALAAIDVVFIALHGSYGEDGTVQRILERHSIPYTGSKAYPSAVAMNKMLAKEHLKDSGIKMAPHMRVSKSSIHDIARLTTTIESLFGPKYVIKPLMGGSSLGVVMANGSAELCDTLKKILQTYDDVLVEERIIGREATCGVVENFRDRQLYSLPVIEIIPPLRSDFFDTEAKYSGETDEICPGRFRTEQKDTLEKYAKEVHSILNLSQYSRSDFIVTNTDIYFLEVNTLPGLTEISLLPKSLEAVGCSYDSFVEHLLTESLPKR